MGFNTRPDSTLTPGDALPVTAEQVCKPGYSKSVRYVRGETKDRVFRRYGIEPQRGKYEIDHLIPLGLGGSNDIKNLWPESHESQPWNADVKDKLERRLHTLVCNGKLGLEEAQQAIASDWIAAFQKYIGLP
jgi:hypothetical protein